MVAYVVQGWEGMKTTYRVEFKGQTFKRQTERTYTHLVVGRKNIEADIAVAKAQRATYLKNHAFHCQEACEATRKYQHHTPEQLAGMVADAAMSADAYADREVADDLARIEAARALGSYDRYCDLGWAGRLDLAQKNAATRKAFWMDVTILAVSK